LAQPIDLAVLQAAPLTWVDEEGFVHPVPPLDFAEERERLRNSFEEAGIAVSVRFEAATADWLRTVATLGARVLHYSGHGEPDFLAFEDGKGRTHPIEPNLLRSLLEAGEQKVRLVVVSACHSKRAGEAFVKAGVPHVVAIQMAEAVFDDAAREFARAFYLALLKGQTIAQAFAVGRAQVEALPGLDGKKEKKKFVLLPAKADHGEAVFSGLHQGAWIDTTPEAAPIRLPAPPESFLGREIEIAEVVERVLKHRLTTLRGAPGIGKTALGNVAAHYLGERRLFRDGILFVAMRDAVSPEVVRVEIARLLGMQAPDDAALFAALHPLNLLLVLDNCEDVLHAAASAFRDFLAKLLGEAPEVRILATSRRLIGALTAAGVSEIVLEVGRLAPLDAAQLFLDRCPRDLTFTELGNPKPDHVIETLAEHRALRFLAGHPLAIGLAAPVLTFRTLDELADLLETTPASTLAVSGLPEEDRDANLGATFEVSIRQVEEIDPEAVRLFSVMGLLPGGAFPEDLDAIWGDPGWRPRIDLLIQRASLAQLDRIGGERERYSTFPFVTALAEARLVEGDRHDFGIKALEHFGKLSEALYRSLGSEDAQAARMFFTLQEPNLRACFGERRPRPVLRSDSHQPSSLAMLATYMPQLLLFEQRLTDAQNVATLAAEACRKASDRFGEANTHWSLGDLALRSYELDAAHEEYRAALDLFRQIGDQPGEARTRKALGDLALRSDNLDAAGENYRAALDLFRQIGDRLGEANTRRALGDLAFHSDELDVAKEDYRAALDLFQQVGVRFGEARTRKALGDIAISSEDLDAARDEYRAALDLFRLVGDRLGEAYSLACLGSVHIELADWSSAIEHLEASLQISTKLQARVTEASALNKLGWALFQTGRQDDGIDAVRRAAQLYLETHHPAWAVHANRRLADMLEAVGRLEEAEEIRTQLENASEDTGVPGKASELAI
jgi:tetratricopeptide (TPR) repeat protein